MTVPAAGRPCPCSPAAATDAMVMAVKTIGTARRRTLSYIIRHAAKTCLQPRIARITRILQPRCWRVRGPRFARREVAEIWITSALFAEYTRDPDLTHLPRP